MPPPTVPLILERHAMSEPLAFPAQARRPAGLEGVRVPPHSVEAEQAVLGGLMLDNQSWDSVADRLTVEDFYRRDHQLVFKAIAALATAGKPYDVVTVAEWLGQTETLEDAGGVPYLAGLVDSTPTAANILAYADIVRENAVLRKLIEVGTDIAQSAYRTEGRSSQELLEAAEREVYAIAEHGARARKGHVALKDVLAGVVERIQILYERDEPITGLPTGFDDLDDMTSGLQGGDLIIVAGRPSMGKTTFAMNIGENVAIRTHKPVLVFSMEMPDEQLALRMMSSLGRIDQKDLRTGKLSDEDWPRLTSAVVMLSEAPVYIDDTPALSPTEVRARARRLKRKEGLGLVIVDYLQLMQVPGNSENRATEISEISRGLKALAKELSVPVIALSQLNRSLEQRPNKRPVMSDLRESGAIEQDADIIMFIYRDEVYDKESPDKGIAEIIIAKHRNGPIGTVRLTFQGQHTRFDNFAPDRYAGEGFV